MNKKFVVLLFGAPAAGKRTIGRKLEEKYGSYLLDNHHFNNVIMPFVDVTGDTLLDICPAVYKIRTLFLDVVKKHYKKDGPQSYVFTNVLIDDPVDYGAFEELKCFAEDIGAVFLPIELNCQTDILCQRIDTSERAAHYKLTDADILKSFLERFKMATINHPNLLRIDCTYQTPDETLAVIQKHIDSTLNG